MSDTVSIPNPDIELLYEIADWIWYNHTKPGEVIIREHSRRLCAALKQREVKLPTKSVKIIFSAFHDFRNAVSEKSDLVLDLQKRLSSLLADNPDNVGE